jgi:hypothetical protein
MKRLQGRWVIGIALVFMIAATMWFAAPTIAAVTQPTGASVSGGGGIAAYVEHGTIVIEKRDKSTGNIVDLPGVTFNISPNPYTRVTGSVLGVVDNVVDPSGNFDINPLNGIIKLQNVLTGSYSIVETVPPANYLVDPTPIIANVTIGQTTTFVSRDIRIGGTGVPASSTTTLWIMIAIFGTLICGFILWRSRHAQISHP